MKPFFTILVLLTFSPGFLRANTYEQNQIDSLLRIINNPGVKDADRIDPMARLSRLYLQCRDDSIGAAKLIERAHTLARKEKDSKYMIYVYNQELMNCLSTFPKKITLAYQIIDSIQTAIARTGDREAQAMGYIYIGNAKLQTDKEYNFDNHYKALSIAETLPEKSRKKYRLMFDIYKDLYVNNDHKNSENSKKFIYLLLQAAEKTEDNNLICQARTVKLIHYLNYLPNDTTGISQNFTELSDFISNNTNYISLFSCGTAIESLINTYLQIPNIQRKKLIERYVEDFKKTAGTGIEAQKILIEIEVAYAFLQQDYAKAIQLYTEKIKNDERDFPNKVWGDYYNMATVYKQLKQYSQSTDAIEMSLDTYQQYVNIQTEEQRQLTEVKFNVAKQQQQIRQQQRKTLYTVIAAISVIILLLAINLLLNRQRKINRLEKEKAELEAEQAKFMAEQALAEKEKIGERLITNIAELTRKDQLLDKAKDMDSKQLDKAIRREQKITEATKDFTKLFHEIRPEFYERLARQAAPGKLSNTELKYCAYILLRMSNKELANVMNVGYRTAGSQKYNLKKKLHLKEEDSLDEFIVNLLSMA